MPDGLYWKGDNWDATLLDYGDHPGYHIIGGKTNEGRRLELTDYN